MGVLLEGSLRRDAVWAGKWPRPNTMWPTCFLMYRQWRDHLSDALACLEWYGWGLTGPAVRILRREEEA